MHPRSCGEQVAPLALFVILSAMPAAALRLTHQRDIPHRQVVAAGTARQRDILHR